MVSEGEINLRDSYTPPGGMIPLLNIMLGEVIFGQSARSRWHTLLHGSIINRFLREARDATVQVVPLGDE